MTDAERESADARGPAFEDDEPGMDDIDAELTGAEQPTANVDVAGTEAIVVTWHEIQARFVDEPRTAIHDADALVSDLIAELARRFTSEREALAARWSDGDASTEDLRLALRDYRSLFERMVSA